MLPLSIIIPSYNRAALVDKTLQSLTRQSTNDFEVILVDHGSTDNTEEVYEKYKGSLPISYYKIGRDDDQFSAAVPRSIGVQKSASQFISFVDTGMILPPQYAQAHITFHNLHKDYVGIGLQHGLDWQFSETEKGGVSLSQQSQAAEQAFIAFLDQTDVEQAQSVLAHPELLDRRVDIDLKSSNIPWFYGWTANLSMPREAYLAAGGFDLELKGWGFEDVDLCYRLSRCGLKFSFVDDGWGIELPQPRKPMQERLGTHLQNMLQCYSKYRSLALEALILRQTLLQQAAKTYRTLPTKVSPATIHDQMREEFARQAEGFFEVLSKLGQTNATLPSVPDEIHAQIAQPALLIGAMAQDAEQYDYVALGDERVMSTSSIWSCCGVLIPLPDQALGTVVVSDIWKKLDWSVFYPFGVRSASLLEILISEIKRTARQAIFLHSSSVAGASVETLENLCHAQNLSYQIVRLDEVQESLPELLGAEK